MGPKVSGELKRAHESVMLTVKLDVIKHIWYDLVHYLEVRGTLKIFSVLN